MNQNNDINIPTLTDIIQAGDASMKDFFAEPEADEELEAIPGTEEDIKIADAFEQVTEDETISEHLAEADNTQTDIIITDELKDTINSLVSDALKETMPVIEASFKRKLSRQIIDKLSKK
ncbi:MAG: hypothetical protein OEZ38_13795 [Gammaproteobacteria bacterium]|nr:hypothetical protein [Gammaproteobacteria bacterium]